MLLNVQELVARQLPVQLQGTLDAADILRGNADYVPLGPLEFKLTAQPADDIIFVNGQLSCNVRLQCSRCLDQAEKRFVLSFDEQYKIVEDPEAEFDEEDEAIPVAATDRIDLAPFLAQELIVQLPYAPLCKEDCQGLCPECGANRNEQSCGCNTEKIDPRLAALQDWFKPQQE
ncbi:YceD family protein [Cohnella sp. GCM10027633]|uniref:YceD family protein n=1 Tax=unclassified Cohnella TaxID=2636738 RepID=UPI00363CCABB